MEIQRFILNDDDEQQELNIGLLQMRKSIPDFELFYQINQLNDFCFERIDDLIYQGTYYEYAFTVFEGYSKEYKTYIRFIANKSTNTRQIREVTELFVDEESVKYLINNHKQIDYIISIADSFADFSLILLPENLTDSILNYKLDQHEDVYQMILYYE